MKKCHSVLFSLMFFLFTCSVSANAIAISSVSPDGLNRVLQKVMKKGDSDVNPAHRSFYVDQGTPDMLEKMLVDMIAYQVPPSRAEVRRTKGRHHRLA